MKCESCERKFEFPVYEPEIIIEKGTSETETNYTTTKTGKILSVCPLCNTLLYGNPIITENFIRGPQTWAKKKHLDTMIDEKLAVLMTTTQENQRTLYTMLDEKISALKTIAQDNQVELAHHLREQVREIIKDSLDAELRFGVFHAPNKEKKKGRR